jgi:hypothetical protein
MMNQVKSFTDSISITDYFAGIDIYYGGKVDETIKYPDIGDIRTPDLIDTGKFFIFNQIRVYSIIMFAIGSSNIFAFYPTLYA